ncbi:hypothetical protein [Inconstantimicrobium mannanitabidum]|uniref:Uncharacterized protein n=1 Tax=Inconstantimicrobium mannanitabidum TaxID=1604901 RepID=A0ACB5RIP3_9CLOT|nr:hypothetical protein [Clostridium sp. TW13]GKX68998.1 hypothetical protein rsdtw13_42560 [Clostridium sp. TW13]
MSSKSTDLFKNLKLNAKKNQEEVISLNGEEEEVSDAFQEVKGTVIQSFNFQNDENKEPASVSSVAENTNTQETKLNKQTADIKAPEVKVETTEVKKVDTNVNETNASLADNRANTGSARGLTPEIEGERLCIKRSYQYRESTLRKLNELKAVHPDVNVYLNTIIDAAINHYYDYIMNQGGKQK